MPGIQRHLTEMMGRDDLARSDWRRQTDVVQITVAIAQMAVEAPGRFVFVDGRMSHEVRRSVAAAESPTAFINKRCDKYGLKCQRIIFLDTKSTSAMGSRTNDKENLHFHGAFIIPEDRDEAWLRKQLKRVMGDAKGMGGRQFHIQKPDPTKGYSFADRKGHGALGKLNYMLAHAGPTHRALELNDDGKRSRKAPASKRKANKNSRGIAKGIPSNFVKSAVIVDRTTMQNAKQAFDCWIETERRKQIDPMQVITDMAIDTPEVAALPEDRAVGIAVA